GRGGGEPRCPSGSPGYPPGHHRTLQPCPVKPSRLACSTKLAQAEPRALTLRPSVRGAVGVHVREPAPVAPRALDRGSPCRSAFFLFRSRAGCSAWFHTFPESPLFRTATSEFASTVRSD